MQFKISKHAGHTLKWFDTVPERYRKATDMASQAVVRQFVRELKSGIFNGSLGVAPKKRPSSSNITLVDTGAYVRSIVAARHSQQVWGVTADDKKLAFAEDGTKRQVARPHWGPLVQKFNRTGALNAAFRVALAKGLNVK